MITLTIPLTAQDITELATIGKRLVVARVKQAMARMALKVDSVKVTTDMIEVVATS